MISRQIIRLGALAIAAVTVFSAESYAAFVVTPTGFTGDASGIWKYASAYSTVYKKSGSGPSATWSSVLQYNVTNPGADAWYVAGSATSATGSSANIDSTVLATLTGLSASTFQSVYKATPDWSDTNPPTSYSESTASVAWDSYASDFDIIDPEQSGKITYDGPGSWVPSAAKFLVLKDANLGSFVFNVSAWNGTEVLSWNSFWADIANGIGFNGSVGGKLSHVELFGSFTDDSFEFVGDAVPEPASIAMWLTVAVGGAFVARRKSKKAVC